MGQAMGGYYGAAYGPLGASMAAAAAAAAQQNAISAALTTPNSQVRTQNVPIYFYSFFFCWILQSSKERKTLNGFSFNFRKLLYHKDPKTIVWHITFLCCVCDEIRIHFT